MNNSIHIKRVEKLRKRLKKTSHDTAWIIQPENRRYLSGFKAMDPQFTESAGSLIIGERSCIFMADPRYALEAQREVSGFQLKVMKHGIVKDLCGLARQMGAKKLGFEGNYLTWGLHHELALELGKFSPPVQFVPLNGVVGDMREIKDDYEIAALRASARLICSILNEVIKGLEPGMSERDVASEVEHLAREGGAEGLAFSPIVASGPNSALPHATPTDRRLQRNEPIILDVGVRLNGYCSDITRTVFLGGPDPYFKTIYTTVRRAQLAAIKEVTPGIRSSQPDKTARQIIKDAGFDRYFTHALGHGVGLATHERPRLGPNKPTNLQKGMVVTVEPGVYIPEKGGIRLEEMILVDDHGPVILTRDTGFYDFED